MVNRLIAAMKTPVTRIYSTPLKRKQRFPRTSTSQTLGRRSIVLLQSSQLDSASQTLFFYQPGVSPAMDYGPVSA
jgi:hypothetical protein